MMASKKEGDEWWYRVDYAEALRNFRNSLSNVFIEDERSMPDWIRLGLIGHVQGHSVEAARMIRALMHQKQQLRQDLWRESFKGAAEVVHFKMVLALAEDCDSTREEILEMLDFFEQSTRRFGVAKSSIEQLRLAVWIRLGEVPMAARAYPRLRGSWDRNQERVESEDSSEDAPSEGGSLCHAGAGQLLVESLLLASREEEALALAETLLRGRSCEGPCESGPHGLLAWILHPLLDLGKKERAEQYAKKGRAHAPASDPRHLGAAGERILFYARTGFFAEAVEQIRMARPVVAERKSTPWQFLRFGARVSAARCLRGMEEALEADEDLKRFAGTLLAKGHEVAHAFDRRNGNSFVSFWWDRLLNAVEVVNNE